MEHSPVVVKKCEITEELVDDSIVMVKVTIKYPQISGGDKRVMGKVNGYYANMAAKCLCFAKRNLLPVARAGFAYSVENNIPFFPHEMAVDYEITYNRCGFLSLYHDHYVFTGGAHGNTERCGDTWNLCNGWLMKLGFFFPNCRNYKRSLIDNIKDIAVKQINAGTHTYFEDYNRLIKKYFCADSYYLCDDGIAIFYGQYEIAPYSEGIPVFIYRCNWA
jgi:hypothetical protein